MKSVMEEEFPDLGNLGDTIAKATQDAQPRSVNFWSWKICQPFFGNLGIHEKHMFPWFWIWTSPKLDGYDVFFLFLFGVGGA